MTAGQIRIPEGYELLEVIAAKGMFQTVRVKQLQPGSQEPEECLLRILHPVLAKDPEVVRGVHEFFERYQSISGLEHLPRVYAVSGTMGGQVYVKEEYVGGRPFADVVNVDPAAALPVLGQVCEALHAAHQKGVFHLCIMPNFVRVCEGDRTKLGNFGLAVALSRKDAFSEAIKGYVAPEVLEEGKYDERSDVYSLGVMIGRLLPDVAGHAVVRRATAVRSGERHRNTRELKAGLEGVFGGGGETPFEDAAGPGLTIRADVPVRVVVLPLGTEVSVDGEVVGITEDPETMFQVTPGRRTFGLGKEGYQGKELTLDVEEGIENKIGPVRLNARPVLLRTEPTGAIVKVGGRLVGSTGPDGLMVPWDRGDVWIERQGYKPERIEPQWPSPGHVEVRLTRARKVRSHIVWAILATMFCFLPTGIVAWVHAARVSSRLRCGDAEGALSSSRRAVGWVVATVVLGLMCWGFLGVVIVGGMGELGKGEQSARVEAGGKARDSGGSRRKRSAGAAPGGAIQPGKWKGKNICFIVSRDGRSLSKNGGGCDDYDIDPNADEAGEKNSFKTRISGPFVYGGEMGGFMPKGNKTFTVSLKGEIDIDRGSFKISVDDLTEQFGIHFKTEGSFDSPTMASGKHTFVDGAGTVFTGKWKAVQVGP